ncbi:hypothetical protein [Mucilaginibacter gracilis]|nr:hypothetical protein [Mucilaginibacter gracilis]
MIIRTDDAAALEKVLTKDSINTCYGNYSLLSQAVRTDANNALIC